MKIRSSSPLLRGQICLHIVLVIGKYTYVFWGDSSGGGEGESWKGGYVRESFKGGICHGGREFP